ncbi:putative ABC-class ATPase [Catenibacillus scindens]|uniref:Putative ABC-class ATPase n=1 Tax=Catenibacillus scindens TaxID=673271 RepID=A0A7W8H928_9FIRM|nr:ABC-ATPase domain-containing protein [Catenibacillus scindens]MBB5264047.1 putative ABC-class ATPase [Catenibacillus scindens]
MKSSQDLKDLLNRIDHRGYPAYKETQGAYQFPGYILSIDHVQGDPFASPSKISVHVSGLQANFPSRLYDQPWKRTALCDTLLRLFSRQAESFTFKASGSGKSGLISVSKCGQEVLARSACTIDPGDGRLTLRLEVGFPANGRTINARELIKIFFEFLPVCVKKALFFKALDSAKIQAVIDLSDDQQAIRRQLPPLGLCAFVADGAVLPRASGISQKSMAGAVTFKSPASMSVTLNLSGGRTITGMGIPKGITLIVGGGYHGKSTLLEALERGVYNHIAGDGREYVITDSSAMKIRAEDGRSIRRTDISMFINNLPNHKDTKHFLTEDASGSTSQAANVVEAMEAGAKLLLIDEDTSASNFMVRDALMEKVVSQDSEPITPLVHRIGQLWKDYGISTILVAGSSGAFFDKADVILQMDQYIPKDITKFAKEQARLFGGASPQPSPESQNGVQSPDCSHAQNDSGTCPAPDFNRIPLAGKNSPAPASQGRRGPGSRENGRDNRVKIKVNGRDSVSINKETIDLRYVEQLVDSEQLTTLGYLLAYAQNHFIDGARTLTQIVDLLEETVRSKGLASVCESSYLPSGLAMPRRQEIFAAFNRYRSLNTGKDQQR